jgi:hypothetical protein
MNFFSKKFKEKSQEISDNKKEQNKMNEYQVNASTR